MAAGISVEYIDLAPYGYQKFPLPILAIGWLGREHGVQGADASEVTPADLERLKSASRRLGSLTLGMHDCEFCPAGAEFTGNGEYRYYGWSGAVYSAPMMVLHYVESHGYRPPREFLADLPVNSRPDWDWRADRLAAVVRDPSHDLVSRCEAVIDLARWEDPRALAALEFALRDEELVDVSGDEIGRSLGLLLHCEFASGIDVESLPDIVRFGIDQILQG